ncbi:tetratricopeptide repeat protein [Myxococcota bacterium]|nr:tetratricopeptide repeat protein [Myxococcota bacterium]MCZ7618548.1 tetratricopeptide repeat protein [Myxococcota bacterium]
MVTDADPRIDGGAAACGSDDAMRVPVRAGILLALALAVVAVSYSSALPGGFVWDDHQLIDEQPFTQELQPLSAYFERSFWFDPTNPVSRSFYRPLVSLSYALEWQFWDGRAPGFHLTNLLLHLVCCALVYGLARRAGAAPLPAAFGAALFGTLPRLTESVAWISGRTDVMASLGALGALWLHRPDPDAGWRRVGAGVLIFVGLASKEVALAGALAIVALELAERRVHGRPWRATALNLVPTSLAVAACGFLRAASSSAAAPTVKHQTFELSEHLFWFPLQALGHYAHMWLDPLRPRTQIGHLGLVDPLLVGVGAAVALAIASGGIWLWRRRVSSFRVALVCLALAALAPVLHVIPLQVGVLAADRFLYLPTAGIFAVLAAAVGTGGLSPRLRTAGVATAVVVLIVFGVTTHRRAPVWGDDLLLWQDAAVHPPRGNSYIYAQLGSVLSWRGKPEWAIDAYRQALAIEQEYPVRGLKAENPRLLANLGLILSEVGEYDEARMLLERVVAMRPDFASYRLDLAAVHARALDFDAAEAAIGGALELVADFPEALQLLDQVRSARARWASLPFPAPDEPLEVMAERARVYALVGRLRDADRLWTAVATSPDAPPKLLVAAALHLTNDGRDPEAAQRVLQRLRLEGAPEARVAQLAGTLAARRLLK